MPIIYVLRRFLSEIFKFLEVNFPIYLDRRVFIMGHSCVSVCLNWINDVQEQLQKTDIISFFPKKCDRNARPVPLNTLISLITRHNTIKNPEASILRKYGEF